MPEYVLVPEEKHDRRLKAFFVACSHGRATLPCRECRSYVGCLRTRAYNEMGLIFDPLKKSYRDNKGRIVKRLR